MFEWFGKVTSKLFHEGCRNEVTSCSQTYDDFQGESGLEAIIHWNYGELRRGVSSVIQHSPIQA